MRAFRTLARLRQRRTTKSDPWRHRGHLDVALRAAAGLAAVTAAVAAAACADQPRGVYVENAALALPAAGSLAVLYFTARNGGPETDTLLRVTIEGATATSMHSARQHTVGLVSVTASDAMTAVPLPVGRDVPFAPGGLHVMVQVPPSQLRRGATMRMALHLADGDSVIGVARVVSYAELDSVLTPPTAWQRVTRLARAMRAAASGDHCAPVDAPDAAIGRELYFTHGCASCHGPLGRGDGPVAVTLNPPPRDFRDAAAFKNGTGVAAIAQTVAQGIPGGGAMPAFPHLGESERQSLALFVISLQSAAKAGSPKR